MFQDMMDRIEDETIRYLFFLQVTSGEPGANGLAPGRPVLPFSPDGDEESRKRRTKRPWLRPSRAAPRRAEPPSRISPATSSAKKKRKWLNCNSSAAAVRPPKTNRPSQPRRPAAMIPAPAAAARNIKNVTEHPSRPPLRIVRLRGHLAAATRHLPTEMVNRLAVPMPPSKPPKMAYRKPRSPTLHSPSNPGLQRPHRRLRRLARSRQSPEVEDRELLALLRRPVPPLDLPSGRSGTTPPPLPRLHSRLDYLPTRNRIPQSERYILGPE